MLAWTVYISFIGVAALMFVPQNRPAWARWIAFLTALLGFCFGLAGMVQYPGNMDTVTKLQTVTQKPWIPGLGISYFLGADGISLVLVLLTGLAAIVGILFSWNIENRAKEFFAFYLALIGGVYGVFLSFDLFLLFVFYELAIIPKYFLIAIWGSTNREYGAMKLALYSFIGSAMVLVGIIAAYVMAGAKTMNLFELAQFPFPESFQHWAFPLVFIGFAILAGIWPFHTWAPTGHVAAPTAASMLLAGVVMKLGAYGALRVSMTLFPLGLGEWSVPAYSPHIIASLLSHSPGENILWAFHLLGFNSWRGVIGLVAVIGIVYGAMVALVQKDFKFVIGYSSVSHMGFVLLGLVTLNTIGLSGAVLQMFSHGIIAGLLFAVVGRMVYDRTHTRDLTVLEGMNLRKRLPFAATVFAMAAFASMGLPGFSGFAAELQVLIGAWQAFPTFAVLAGFGILVGVAYTLRVLQKSFFGDAAPAAVAEHEVHPCPSISMPERIGAAILLAMTIFIGLFPNVLLKMIGDGFNSSLFSGLGLWKGGAL